MRILDIGLISQRALFAGVAILILVPGISPAFDDIASNTQRAAVSARPESSRGAHGYSSVLLAPLLVGFTNEFLADRDQNERRIAGADVERMRRHYREIVGPKLPSQFAIAEAPGPGVLRADAYLIDHVLDKSDWLAPVTVGFRTAPRVRVVVFLRDSQTDELVDSVGLTLAPRGSRLMRDSPGFYWNYMRLVLDRLGTRMRWALENGAASSLAGGNGPPKLGPTVSAQVSR
jgi:hypothetical protein